MRLPKSAAAAIAIAPLLAAVAHAKVEFNRDIRPLLSDRCFVCHGPDKHDRKAGLDLSHREGATAERKGVRAIDPDKLSESELIHRISSADPDEMMPPPELKKPLTDAERELLRQWIVEGAEYQSHWAWITPKKSPPPTPTHPHLVRNPIDAFVQARLQPKGLEPAPEANRETLIRRVTFDLTGLPPTPAEVDAFLADTKAGAYERLVDRLLASPSYGERMTLAWMDAARYGDSSVMHADGPRYMWAWRDWVIDAYNANMPFNRFTTEQIAGDLLPDATTAQKIASGFNRNHATSDEGGAIAEELRVEYVVDRVKTTSTVWLAASMECGQCHDHKYDPFSQEDYYSFAYFNNTTDPGMQTRNGNQAPVVEVTPLDQQKRLAELDAQAAAARRTLEEIRERARPGFGKWLAAAEGGTQSVPAPAGLAHWFPLDEQKGKTITDKVGGASLRLAGKLQSIERIAGQRGLQFNGKTRFTYDKFPDFERDQPFTFAAWLKLPKNGAGSVVARMDVATAYRGYDIWIQGRQVGTHIINTWPSNALKVVSADALKENTWHHVCITYDGSSKPEGVRILIDGKLSGNTVEQNSLRDTIKTATPFVVGSRSNGGFFNGAADDIRLYGRVLSDAELARLGADPIKGILATPAAERSDDQKALLFEHFLASENKEFKESNKRLAELSAQQAGIKNQSKVTSMIMQDNPANKMRVTYVLNRGHYADPIVEKPIPPGVPASLGGLPEGAPPNRLGLAQWLVKPDHPLTARVAVNRYWSMFFGQGIVRTLSDFGNQGEWPSHPALLDWLAVDFVENGWDVKRMVKQLVTSHTYRQSSRFSNQTRDPQNRLLARGPRFRLQGEFIRDHALAISGLLNGQIGGPSVKPYQPPNIWNEVSLNGGLRYQQDHGEKLYRRSMYTYWKRSAPMPNLVIFDAPSREKCTVQRPRTNTPLQALVILNDPQFVEAARFMAQRLVKQAATPEDRIQLAYRLALSRHASAREVEILTATLRSEHQKFTAEPKRAKQLLAVGEAKRDESIPLPDHAAWTIIAQMVLNLDECLSRN